ncbi:hypothetical protein PIB30_006284 [Stylosanthes scabra]|uniref:Uncharacterized protein n=1 Tax=Stylosanthes scabra TaxID=79078 RepID=A0ABU6Q4A0_9FABA|nr:hypothetical protein [Stylosanthes scabra]
MEPVSLLPFNTISGKFENDFAAKLRIYDDDRAKNEDLDQEQENEEHEEEEEEEEEEFSFVFSNPEVSPVSADDVFDNGQIRPVYPIFDQNLLFSDEYDGGAELRPPLKKLFMEQQQRDDAPSSSSSDATATTSEGPYCEWSPKMAGKSNSTGFSKLWKLRDQKLRSNSDGKDAFVFLNPPSTSTAKTEKAGSGNVAVKKAVKVTKGKTTSSSSSSSAHEKHYVMNRAKKESDKRRSYLPYRQELFGFFSSTNALSRNVHPY